MTAGRPTEWIFLRHGESVANADGWLSGWEDVALTARGEVQALEAGLALAGVPLGRCLVSDLGRARHTARLALGDRRVPVHVLGDLRERHMGALQRVSLAVCAADGSRERYLLRWDEGPPGGESRRQAVRRALASLRCWDDGTPTLVVGHGSVLRGVVAAFDGVSPEDLHTLP
ncbi:MAG: histidine phosphatase family protein, partial [Myxococcota bacterium]